MSYKSHGGRIPQSRHVENQGRTTSTPTIAAKPEPLRPGAPSFSRPQLPRLTKPSLNNRREGSMSDAKESRPLIACSDSSPASDNFRPCMPPRATTHPFASRSPLNTTPDRHTPQALRTPAEPRSPPSNEKHAPVPVRPRNVLRRKAPTIGLNSANNSGQTESKKRGGLNVIIPNSTAPDLPQPTTSQLSNRTEVATERPSPMANQDQPADQSPERQVRNGPKELASLRATINTQNLPSPTPLFPSASTPSTRYSGSPGVWSRTSTPASLSSCSPGIVQSTKVGPRVRQPSPSHTRLPVFSVHTQKSPAHCVAGGESPNLLQGTGSSMSIASESREDSTRAGKPKLARSKPPAGSLLPRRTSLNSTLPMRAKVSQDISFISKRRETERSAQPDNLAQAQTSVNPSVQIPSRPSREGTHQLELEPSPIVKTNISPRAVRGHRRRSSGESSIALAAKQPATALVDSLHSCTSSRIRSPSSPELTRRSPRTLTKETSKVSPADSSPAKFRGFGLFPKKPKPDLDGRLIEARRTRKGPAAGTGHEGYGKYAQRGRKTSISGTSDTRARSTSTTRSSTKSVSSGKGSSKGRPDMELDDFLLERLEPVYINGGGMDGAVLSRTHSEQSTSGLSTKSAPGPIESFMAPSSPRYLNESSASSKARTLDLGESHRRELSSPATIAARPKIHAVTNPGRPKPRRGNSSTQSSPQTNVSGSSTPHMASAVHLKKPSKMGLNIKWPFFQRDSEKDVMEPKASVPSARQLPAQIAPVGISRPVAHYALVDTDSDPLEDIFHNLEDSPPTEEEDPILSAEMPAALGIRKAHESILLPSPPQLHAEFPEIRPESPKIRFQTDSIAPKQETAAEGQRPSRLASVGRIPRVVSRRDRQHKPPLQSFSRPFSVTESPSLTAPVTDPHGFSPSKQSAKDCRLDRYNPGNFSFDVMMPFGDPRKRNVLDFLAGPYSKHEFIAFSPRKDSTFSTSSGSESLAAITAVIPNPESELTEDEIWDEYDDFIDHVLSPGAPTYSFPRVPETSEKFELATVASRALQAGLNGGQRNPAASTRLLDQPTISLTPASRRSSVNSIRLRRSKIANALHSSLSPTSQPSVSDLMARFRDSQDEVLNSKEPADKSTSTITIEQPQPNLLSSPSLDPSPSFKHIRQRNTILFDMAERDREGLAAQTNIRSGSLMTSRWLSFGRVLFSPAHNHIKDGEQEKILVVDGLGNDDWSFYCALTYPNADVYCLHEGPSPTTSKHPAAWQPPANHHTIHHASLEDPVPFPKAFFTVTVLRFPAACSEQAQNNVISECKRVLRPGGYLEMSVLDLDMVNMGIRTRKAVRKLKETMYVSDPSISLKPASDSIQKLLGRHGFDSLRRCMVRIPVAGVIVRSSASSSSTSSSNPSTSTAALTRSGSSVEVRSNAHEKSSSNDTVLSLGDLLSDPSPSPSNDESIRKIVARVGRWWYTRCYECPVLPNGDVDRSIWADKKVIRECQQRGTGFRLLIAYTQKPSEKRRTASV